MVACGALQAHTDNAQCAKPSCAEVYTLASAGFKQNDLQHPELQ